MTTLKLSSLWILLMIAASGCTQEPPAPKKLSVISPGDYVAVESDNLSSISLRAYGDMDLWIYLLNANPQLAKRPRFVIEPEEVIKVPPLDQLDRKLPKSVFPDTLPADYIIMPGDSLTFIAKGCYGDPELWTRIYDANRSSLSERVKQDPRQITAGEVLRIPAAPDAKSGDDIGKNEDSQ